MAPLTKSNHDEIWTHLLTVVLPAHKVDDKMWKLLAKQGIKNVNQMMQEQDDHEAVKLWECTIMDTDGTTVKETYTLERYEVNQFFMLKDFIWREVANKEYDSAMDMTKEDYLAIDNKEFMTFTMDPSYKMQRERVTLTPRSNAPGDLGGNGNSGGGGRNNFTPVDIFKKSIKRDPQAFDSIKKDEFFDTWNRGVTSTADIQDVLQVLDHKYVPIGTEDEELFTWKQKYMYAVFEKTMLSDKGKEIVRKHQAERDAQKVYAEFCDHCKDSVKARLDSGRYLTYITTAKLGDGHWTSTTSAFIIYWREQVRLFNTLVPKSEKLNEKALLMMLQNAVHANTDLRQIMTTTQIQQAATGKPTTFEEYYALLTQAAAGHDAHNTARTPKPIRSQRGIYNTEINDGISGLTEEHGLEVYNIDTDLRTIEANMANRNPATNMGFGKWQKLSATGKTTWDQLDDDDKATILGPTFASKPSQQLGHNARDANKFNNSNFHRNLKVNESELDNISARDFLDAVAHDRSGNETASTSNLSHMAETASGLSPIQAYIADKTARNDKEMHPAHLQRFMSTQQATEGNAKVGNTPTKLKVNSADIEWNGQRIIMAHEVIPKHTKYRVSSHDGCRRKGGLVDRGANGGVAGKDVRTMHVDPIHTVDITGIDHHQIRDIKMGTVGGVINTTDGPVIAIFHQQALHGQHASIFSAAQMEASGCDVNDRSLRLKTGRQRIVKSGYVIPLAFRNGLPRLKIRPYTDDELAKLPQVILADDGEWDPTILDNEADDDPEWFDAIQDNSDIHDLENPLFDKFGNYRRRTVVNQAIVDDFFLNHYFELEESIIPTHDLIFEAYPTAREIKDAEPDYEKLRANFAWQPLEIVKRTFECTTQYGRLPMGDKFQKMFKSPNPALNVKRRDEDLATDTVYAPVPAIDDGSTIAQFYCGTSSLVCDVQGIKTESQFVNTLDDEATPANPDPTRKFKDLVELLEDRWGRTFEPGQALSLDETLIRAFGRIKFKVRVITKAARYGIKLYVITDAETGFVLKTIVYTGREDEANEEDASLGKTTRVVKHLMAPYCNTKRTVYIDRFYTSVEVCKEIEKMGCYVTGTVMANRIPKELRWTKKYEREMNRGDHETHTYQYEENTIGLVIWKDRRPVYILTSDGDCSQVGECKRRSKAEKGIITLSRPTIVYFYNKFMGGVDVSDMRRLFCETRVHSLSRWWIRIFFYYLDTSSHNAMILFKLSGAKEANQKMNLLDYKHGWLRSYCGSRIKDVVRSPKEITNPCIWAYHQLQAREGPRRTCAVCLVAGRVTRDQGKTNLVCPGCTIIDAKGNKMETPLCNPATRLCSVTIHQDENARLAILAKWKDNQMRYGRLRKREPRTTDLATPTLQVAASVEKRMNRRGRSTQVVINVNQITVTPSRNNRKRKKAPGELDLSNINTFRG